MKPTPILLLLFLICGLNAPAQRPAGYPELRRTHDLNLLPWGPYSKKYAGVSHIAAPGSGIRLDFSLVASADSLRVIPHLLSRSAVHPWSAGSDLRDYRFRYELLWKDRLFMEARYQIAGPGQVVVSAECVNRTEKMQSFTVQLISQLAYPEHYPARAVVHDKSAFWVNAVDYHSLRFHTARPKDNLADDGWQRAEVRGREFIDGSALGDGFGMEKGDQVSYKLGKLKAGGGVVTLVYLAPAGARCAYTLSGIARGRIELKGSGKPEQLRFGYHLRKNTEPVLTLVSAGGDAIHLNGLLLSAGKTSGRLELPDQAQAPRPAVLAGETGNSFILKYRDVPQYYGIAWRQGEPGKPGMQVAGIAADTVPAQEITFPVLRVPPGGRRALSVVIYCGSLKKVRSSLRRPAFDVPAGPAAGFELSGISPAGRKYVFSQQLLQATLLTNVVYPIYTQRSYIRHFTPGKWWNSLYTWDSGFTALGLAEVDLPKAVGVLNTYTTRAAEQPAFIHHGSMVPVQIYTLLELWNRTQSTALLKYFYPQLKRYYRFISGRDGSTMNDLQSGLLRPWDYFYNSGGWDDYPAQLGLRKTHDEARITPVITTAQAIRCAKILRMAAKALHMEADLQFYDRDISRFSEALQRYAWNDAAGYFSYVVHDKAGRPAGHYRHQSGQDFNMGLDGAYPLHAGICSGPQEKILLGKMFSDTGLWTPAGLGVVDRSAAYYNPNGYWNGSVWMPHQWFMWKTMLDLNRPGLARKIARRALDVYAGETGDTYNTFEHFKSASAKGAGWHQFAGLSAPVLSWFAAYYRPGRVTAGFEVWISSRSLNPGHWRLRAELAFDEATPPHQRSLLVCLNPAYTYRAFFAGKPVPLECPMPGVLEISLPASNRPGRLLVEPLR